MSESATRDVLFRLSAEPKQGAIQNAEKFGKRLEEIQRRVYQSEDRFQRQSAADHSRYSADRLRVLDREGAAFRRSTDERTAVVTRFYERQQHQQKAAAAESRKTRQQQAEEQHKAIQATEREMASATGRLSAANSMLETGLTSAGESIVRMGTGLATIGLLNQKNSESLLRGLVLVKGINDTLAGSINAYVRIGKLAEGYRATLEAVKATQAAINAQQAIGAATAGAGARGAARGAAGGMGGSVVGGAAGGAALTGLQRAALGVGSALGSLKTAAMVTAAPLAKLGVVAAGSLSIFDMIASGQIKPREGSVRAGAANAAGGAIAGFMGFASSYESDDRINRAAASGGTFAGAEQSRRKTEKMQEERDRLVQQREARRAMAGRRLERTEAETALQLHPYLSAVENSRGQGKLQAIDQARGAIAERQRGIQATDVGNDADLQADRLQQVIDLDQRSVSLARERMEEEKRILQTKREAATVAIDSSREELSNAKQTLSETKDRITAIRESLMTAEQKFGQMDPKQQKALLEVGKKARAGEDLSRDERAMLLQDGIGTTRDVAQQQAIQAAQQAGFREVFGVGMRQEQKQLEAEAHRQQEIAKRIQQKIKIEEKLVVEYDLDIEQLTDMVVDGVEERMARMRESLQLRIAKIEERQWRQNAPRLGGSAG